MAYFIFGVFLSALASMFAYFVNYCYVADLGGRETSNSRPFIVSTKNAKAWRIAGVILHFIAVVLIVGSYLCFAIGTGVLVNATSLSGQ
jgi:hypothetical protein